MLFVLAVGLRTLDGLSPIQPSSCNFVDAHQLKPGISFVACEVFSSFMVHVAWVMHDRVLL